MEAIVAVNPQSALDIGVGNGKWGYLVREYIDIWQGRHAREQWEVHIEGIEVWEPYIHEYQRAIYDQIYIGRAQDVVPTLSGSYDLILACDVIEHLAKEDALRLIAQLQARARKLLLLSIPLGPGWLRKSYNENPYEAHLSEWRADEFRGLGACRINVSTGVRVIWLMNGMTRISSSAFTTLVPAWHIVGAAECNGDTKPDLVWENTSSKVRVIWSMGGMTRTNSVAIAPPDNS